MSIQNLTNSEKINSIPEIQSAVSTIRLNNAHGKSEIEGFKPGIQELDVRVFDKIDSTGHQDGYFNKVKKSNKTRLRKVMNGMDSFHDITFLKVQGINQLSKEIAETQDIDEKMIDTAALHRNEQTDEIEGKAPTP